jgi:hypothetical protein
LGDGVVLQVFLHEPSSAQFACPQHNGDLFAFTNEVIIPRQWAHPISLSWYGPERAAVLPSAQSPCALLACAREAGTAGALTAHK